MKQVYVWVKGGKVVETKSWLVRPEDNRYSYWNMQVHGIRPQDTAYAPTFSKIWEEITTYLKDCPVLVAHNATFDMRCIRHALQLTIYLVLTLIITVRSVPPDISMISVVIRSTIFATISLYRMVHTTVLAMMPKCVLGYFCKR